ncbi:hypothetical protein ACFFHM_22860 [Halalkalibacter kiskunsagensis]|uniref:Uncharacterized protein n=1 Tax=Halalkalibacter kiskunsagensis TaxID=1548599 RepID=A0ABV6KIU9_9BACI
MKQRLFMSFLLSVAMLIYGAEYLPYDGTVIDQIFAWSWTVFALLVIGGNGLHLLYQRRPKKEVAVPIRYRQNSREKLRG